MYKWTRIFFMSGKWKGVDMGPTYDIVSIFRVLTFFFQKKEFQGYYR